MYNRDEKFGKRRYKKASRRFAQEVFMQENVERELNLFITRAEELEKSSFLLATPKITALLQAIANSPALCKLLGNCTANFSYGEEFNRAFPERAEGQVYTSAIRLPEDPARRVSLVFCILMDIDSQKIDFYQFLASCFPGDGSYYESFNAFARELIAPFRLTLAALLQAVESGKEEIAEPVPHIAASKAIDKVFALLKQDKELLCAVKLDEKTAGEISELTDGFTAALKTGEREFIRLTYLGYRYALKAVKREFNIGKIERILQDGGLI